MPRWSCYLGVDLTHRGWSVIASGPVCRAPPRRVPGRRCLPEVSIRSGWLLERAVGDGGQRSVVGPVALEAPRSTLPAGEVAVVAQVRRRQVGATAAEC